MLGAVLGVLALAAFARFDDLGGAPLAEDEYYTARSIEWILADGVPAIPSGGYYVRAPLIQYAAAGFARLFGADAFAYRLPSALCGLLLGAIGFLYARRFGGLSLGLAVAAALLLSSWEIEFGRMARFYTPFEVAVLLFLIALDRAYFEARPGWRYLPHATLLLAALVHDLTLLLTPLLFLPLLPGCTRLRLEGARRWLGFAMVSLLVTIGLAAMITGAADLRDMASSTPIPPTMTIRRALVGALATPVLPFFRLFPSPLLHLAAVGLMAAFLVAAFLAARRAGARKLEWPDLLLALALLAGVFHLFAALALVLGFAFARYDLWRLRAQPVGRHCPARCHAGSGARLADPGRDGARAAGQRRRGGALGRARPGHARGVPARPLEHLLRLAGLLSLDAAAVRDRAARARARRARSARLVRGRLPACTPGRAASASRRRSCSTGPGRWRCSRSAPRPPATGCRCSRFSTR